MKPDWWRSVRYGALLLAVLGACPLPSYALSDSIISDLFGVLLFGVACVVAVIAGCVALVALTTGSTATGQRSAAVATVAVLVGLLCKPNFNSTGYVSPEEQMQRVPHAFGLISRPDSTDRPTEIPALQTDTLGRSHVHFDQVYTYLPDMPKLPGGNTEAIKFVQQNLHYPAAAREHHTTGIVTVEFVVNETGQVLNARVKKPLGNGCSEEALRVVRGLPSFVNSHNAPVALKWHFSFRPPEEPVPQQP